MKTLSIILTELEKHWNVLSRGMMRADLHFKGSLWQDTDIENQLMDTKEGGVGWIGRSGLTYVHHCV